MDISKHIYDYLVEYNTSVVVPDLGCFTIVIKPSVIQDNKVLPPVKTVVLDSENTEDNKVFTLYIAKKENITLEQAADEVRNFYNQFFIQKLAKNGRPITFENFGTFSLNELGDMQFEPDAHFFKDNYGLGDAHFATIPSPPEVAPVIPEPILPIASEPTIQASYEPIQSSPEPVQPPSEPTQPEQETKDTPPEQEGSLFDTSDTSRFRVKTEQRPPVEKRQEPPARPSQTKKPAPPPRKQPTKKKTSNSNSWVLWILLIAAGLGIAGYFIYPVITETNDKFIFADAMQDESGLTDETPNIDVAQSLDEATDKKNALNPEGNQPTSTSQMPSSQSTSLASAQGSVGSGRFVLIIGSFSTQAAAERYVRTLQSEGIATEVVDAGNERFRVAVASFDTWAETLRQAEQMRSRPYCSDIWPARR